MGFIKVSFRVTASRAVVGFRVEVLGFRVQGSRLGFRGRLGFCLQGFRGKDLEFREGGRMQRVEVREE